MKMGVVKKLSRDVDKKLHGNNKLEMNADELEETTMKMGTRRLKQITVEDAIQTDVLFSTLMGSSAQKRKEWIEETVDFGVIEE